MSNPYPKYEMLTSTARSRYLLLMAGVLVSLPLGAYLGFKVIRTDLVGVGVGLILVSIPFVIAQVVIGVLGSLHHSKSVYDSQEDE